jgi:hypothetical protein
MHSKTIYVLALAAAFTAGACSDDEVMSPGAQGSLEVSSDPAGAAVEFDGVASGKLTPTTFWELSGRHDVVVRLERDGIAYGYRTQIEINRDSLYRINGPLMFRCVDAPCLGASARARDLGRLRVVTQANGALFLREANGQGILWPRGTTDSYVSIGMPLIAMVAAPRDTLALGIYDYDYLAGRPEPTVVTTPDRTTFAQSTWIIPPTDLLLQGTPTVRGIEIAEEIVGTPDSDVIHVKLTFRNITDRATYRAADPLVPTEGLTFTGVYLGFAIDADIGSAADDLITYEPALDMVYMYDANFREPLFQNVDAPGLIGLRMIQKPENTNTVMNAWPGTVGNLSGDWTGAINELVGYGIMSGIRSFLPDDPSPAIGYAPGVAGDYRMLVSAGPVTLAPGESAQITVAVVMAAPVQGEFTPGQTVLPGSPNIVDRPIRRIAATLFSNAQAAAVKRVTSSAF